jgi:hypothetical protein
MKFTPSAGVALNRDASSFRLKWRALPGYYMRHKITFLNKKKHTGEVILSRRK